MNNPEEELLELKKIKFQEAVERASKSRGIPPPTNRI
jgi:hypothetical protein